LRFINIEVDENVHINELIKLSIDKFNAIFDEEKSDYRLSPEYSCYNIKPSKKNGHAKMDYPCKIKI
jgi:hypothetical protein